MTVEEVILRNCRKLMALAHLLSKDAASDADEGIREILEDIADELRPIAAGPAANLDVITTKGGA